MKIRIISGIVLIVLLTAVLLGGGYVTAVCLCLVSLIASYELSHAFALRDAGVSTDAEAPKTADKKTLPVSGMEIVGYLGVILHYALIIVSDGDPRYFIGTMIVFFFAETLIYVTRFPAYHISNLTSTVFCCLYAPVCLSFLCLIRNLEYGKWFVWLPFLAWICDTFAYFSGRAFGKHKLCPKLSPHKTVEGAVGGFAGAILVAGVYGYFLMKQTRFGNEILLAFLVIGGVCGIFSQLGDLLASGIKRNLGIKDYGKMIPGHGGIMDRFDSVIFITPIVYFLLTTFLEFG